MQRSGRVDVSARLLSLLLRERELAPRAALLAQQAAEQFTGAAAVVYLMDVGPPVTWVVKGAAGDIRLEDSAVPAESGPLEVLAREAKPILFSGQELVREDYAHLHARRTLVSLAYVPIVVDETLIGCLEVASFGEPIASSDIEMLADLVELAGPGLVSGVVYEDERNALLESVARLTQLYDLEKVFSSTLEMDELKPLIVSKVREVMDAQAVNLWFVKDQNELLLMDRSGNDPTVVVGSSQMSGQGYVADTSDSGDPLLIADDTDERLTRRNPAGVEGGPFSVVVCPLVAHENQVGVIETINKMDGTPFDEDDLFLLVSICDTAAIALNNAGLLQAERKVEILNALVQVSTEITSTLNLDRVLQSVVNTPSTVIPYERAAVALEERGKLRLKAISGMELINPAAPEVRQLESALPLVAAETAPVLVTVHGDRIEAPREELKGPFQQYFASSGVKAFYAIPLADDEGRLGVLAMESSDPDFLNEAHLEMIKVVAGQATVAVRNASMYKEVPFIALLEPILQRKQKFLALEKRRRILLPAGIGAVALFLAMFPIPMRVDGEATVQAARVTQVQPEVEGVVRRVYVREGEQVGQGQAIADLDDWEFQAALAGAQAKYATANTEMNRALAANDGAQAGVQRVQADYWASEVRRARERLERTHLRALFGGKVVTPHVEDFAGRRLAAGETLAEVADSSQARVDVAVDEPEISLVRAGTEAAVKVEAFPTRAFRGTVSVVSPKSQMEGEDRIFYARVTVPNGDGSLRPGMQGRGKIWIGWRPVGYTLFRRPFMWLYSKLWAWFGW
jgi:RND family efflux transporter MFP subunit